MFKWVCFLTPKKDKKVGALNTLIFKSIFFTDSTWDADFNSMFSFNDQSFMKARKNVNLKPTNGWGKRSFPC